MDKRQSDAGSRFYFPCVSDGRVKMDMNPVSRVENRYPSFVSAPSFGGIWRRKKPRIEDLFDPDKTMDPAHREKLARRLAKQHRANTRFRRLVYVMSVLSMLSTGGVAYLGYHGLKDGLREMTMGPVKSAYEERSLSPAQLSGRPGLEGTLSERYETMKPWFEHASLVSEYVKPAVVEVGIYAEGEGDHGRLQGTGFFVDDEGYLLTNAHVVGQRDEVMITLLNGKKGRGEVVGIDGIRDLAMIRINPADFGLEKVPVLKIADNDARDGDWVMAMGHGLGNTWTGTMGIISSTNRYQGGGTMILQTDAAINSGNSGGPLVDMKGEVVGVNTGAALFFENTGFSVSSQELREMIPLLKDGFRMFLIR